MQAVTKIVADGILWALVNVLITTQPRYCLSLHTTVDYAREINNGNNTTRVNGGKFARTIEPGVRISLEILRQSPLNFVNIICNRQCHPK